MGLIQFVLLNILIISDFKMHVGADEVVWTPLEANPEVLTKYNYKMGATKGTWVSVYALDDDSLAEIPQPVVAVMLLKPLASGSGDTRNNNRGSSGDVANIFFLKQYIENASGTIAIMHSLGNNVDAVGLDDTSILADFMQKTAGMTPDERGEELVAYSPIATLHEEIAEEDQSDQVVAHFIAFVNINDNLYELDGQQDQPINLGQTSSDTFFKDAASAIKDIWNSGDPDEHRYIVMALTLGNA